MREGWVYKKLGEVATVAAGQGAPQGNSNYCENGTPFVKAGNLEELINGVQESEIQKVSEEVAQTHRLKKYRAGSVLFAKSGMSCMKGLVYTLRNACYVVSHLAVITPNKINSSFLNYYFQINKPNNLVKDSAYPSISLKDIENMSVLVPPLTEQERIVSELDLLSSIIEKKKAQLKEYDTLAQSIFYDMFGDPVTNEKGWEVKKLGEECKDIKYGTSQPASENGQFKYLRMGNITYEGFLDLTDIKTINISDDEIEKYVVRRGDILFNRTNSLELIGKTCMFDLDEPMIIAGYIIRVRLLDNLKPVFLSRMFNLPSIKKKFRSMAKGAVHQANINSKELASIPIPLPPLSLQQSFAEKMEAIERQKVLIKQSITETETLFNSRMDYYFN